MAQPRPPSAVVLTEDVQERQGAASQGAVLLGHQVRQELAERSSLLAGIRDTQGMAALPAHLSPDDVDLWQTACLVKTLLSVSELVTVAKVADALNDSNAQTWTDMLARHALSVWPEHGGNQLDQTSMKHKSDDALRSLLRLPSHLLHRIFHACLTGSRTLENLLLVLPFPLHPHLIAAAAATGSLSLPKAGLDMFLVLLASTYVTFPALTSLSLSDQKYDFSNATAALLARALAAHPSLTSLHFSPRSCTLFPCTLTQLHGFLTPSTLPKLARLEIRTLLHPGGCIALAGLLKQLPSLTAADIAVACRAAGPSQGTPLTAYLRAATSPAKMHRLKKLKLEEYCCADISHQQAGTQPPGRACAHLLLPLLDAPALSALRFRTDAVSLCIPDLLQPLSGFASLESLHIDTDAVCTDLRSKGLPEGPQLQRLHTLDVSSVAEVAPVTIAAGIAARARSTLTRLSMHHMHGSTDRDNFSQWATTALAAWGALWGVLRACCVLRHLDLTCAIPGVTGARQDPAKEDVGSEWDALTQLTGLTHLTLMPVCMRSPSCRCGDINQCSLHGALSEAWFDGAALGSLLGWLRNLRTFAFGSGAGVAMHEQKAFFSALLRLPELLSVCLSIRDVEVEAMAEALQTAPQLKSLLLHPASFTGGVAPDPLPASLTSITTLQLAVGEYAIDQIAV